MRPSTAAVLLLISCGTTPNRECSASNCTGCCDDQGVCKAGNEASACGIGGALCDACQAFNTCQLGFCLAGGTAGGSASSGGGSANGGGAGGGLAASGGGVSGSGGGTVSGSGGGTVSGSGGGTVSGSGGGTVSGSGGGTVSGSGGGNISGSGGGITGSGGGTTGSGGGTTGTGGGSASCGPGNGSCNNGCCATNQCRTPIPAACGTNGNVCTACTQGQSCFNGSCGTNGNTYAGSPCTLDTQCTLGGVFGHCRTGPAWPGGYCQDTCYLLSCSGNDVCISNDCYERCPGPGAGQSTCRGGYVCGRLVSGDGGTVTYGICEPDCRVAGCSSGTCGALGYCQ